MTIIELPFLSSSPKFFEKTGRHRFGWATARFEIPDINELDLRFAFSETYMNGDSGTWYESDGLLWGNAISTLSKHPINLSGIHADQILEGSNLDAFKKLSNFNIVHLNERGRRTGQTVARYAYAHAKAKTILSEHDYEREDYEIFANWCKENLRICNGRLLRRSPEPSLTIAWGYEDGTGGALRDSVELNIGSGRTLNNGIHFALDGNSLQSKFAAFLNAFGQERRLSLVRQNAMEEAWDAVVAAGQKDTLVQNEIFIFDPEVFASLQERALMGRRSSVCVLRAIALNKPSASENKQIISYIDQHNFNPPEDFEDKLEELLNDQLMTASRSRRLFVDEALRQLADRPVLMHSQSSHEALMGI